MFSGCGYISLARKTRFVPTTEGVTISIADTETGLYETIESPKSKFKLNHFKKSYFVKQTKVGFVEHARNSLLQPKAPNPILLKILNCNHFRKVQGT